MQQQPVVVALHLAFNLAFNQAELTKTTACSGFFVLTKNCIFSLPILTKARIIYTVKK